MRLIIVLFVISFMTSCKSSYISEVDNVPIITSDVELFYQTLDRMRQDGFFDSIVQSDYFDKGSNGLKALINKDGLQAKEFMIYMREHQDFFMSIRKYLTRDQEYVSMTQEILNQFDQILPGSKYKPIYFLVGQNKHGGTLTSDGFIIELQKNILGLNGIKWGTLDSAKFSVHQDLDQMIAHEQVHVTQKPTYLSASLLKMTINEGIADFISYKITGKRGNDKSYTYGDTNFDSLKSEWLDDLNKPINDVRSKWIWNWGRKSDRPYDLGYYIGFRIAQGYYVNNGANTQTLIEMRDIEDYDDFYAKSGFAN